MWVALAALRAAMISHQIYIITASNQISGTIPSDLGNLSNIFWLDLSKNLLTGSLPEEVKNLTSAAIDVCKYKNVSLV